MMASAPPAPAPPRRSRLFFVLVAVAAVLGLALIAVTAVGLTAVSRSRGDAATLTAQRDARLRGYADADAALKAQFKAADLAGKLARVKELDKAADAAFQRWNNVTGTTLGSLVDAMQQCNDEVILYDLTAAPFPPAMLDTLPDQINLANPETDCGRAFTKNI